MATMIFRRMSIFALSAWLLSCSAHHHHLVSVRWVPEALPEAPIRVAVLPFQSADTTQPDKPMLAALRAAFETELLNVPSYRIVERAQLGSTLSDEVTFDKELTAILEAKQVDAYVIGELRSSDDHVGHAELHAGVKLIDRRTGDVLWSANADIARLGTSEFIAREFAAMTVERLQNQEQDDD